MTSLHLSQLIMELDQIARETENEVIRTKIEAADDLIAVGEQLMRLAGRWKRGEV